MESSGSKSLVNPGQSTYIFYVRFNHFLPTLTLWSRLTRFLDYPQLGLSNNLAENAIRPVAIGRKNWIHLGSQEAGPRIAAIISVIQSCRRLKIPVRDYLASVLPGLADMPMSRIAELTPAAWATRK